MSDTPPPPLFDSYGPPTANAAQQQAYAARTVHGSAGPVIAVLAVITILGAAAVMIGRLCSGRKIFGRGPRYDFESWVETKCSSCVDGRVDSPPAPRRRVVVAEQTHVNRTVEPTAAATADESAGQESNGEDEAEETGSDEQEQPQLRRNHDPPVHPPPLDRSQGP